MGLLNIYMVFYIFNLKIVKLFYILLFTIDEIKCFFSYWGFKSVKIPASVIFIAHSLCFVPPPSNFAKEVFACNALIILIN